MIGRGKGGVNVTRGEGRRSENEISIVMERRGGETSTRGGMTLRTDQNGTEKTSRRGGMILILIDNGPAPV